MIDEVLALLQHCRRFVRYAGIYCGTGYSDGAAGVAQTRPRQQTFRQHLRRAATIQMKERLTEMAHRILAGHLCPGDVAVDATAGNGHDTEFLARAVGAEGRVFAFDIQEEALRRSRKRLEKAGLGSRVDLIKGSHAGMKDALPPEYHGKVRAVMFNLGYLPFWDRSLVTEPSGTLAALDQARALLSEKGVISLIAYRAHPGGLLETERVEEWMGRQSRQGWALRRCPGEQEDSPIFYLLGNAGAGIV